MSDETKVETTEAAEGMAALGAIAEGGAVEAVAAAPVEPNLHREYRTWICQRNPALGKQKQAFNYPSRLRSRARSHPWWLDPRAPSDDHQPEYSAPVGGQFAPFRVHLHRYGSFLPGSRLQE